MNDQPNAVELLNAVRNFIKQSAIPELEGRSAFHARVALNVLDTLIREYELRPAAEKKYHSELSSLLGDDDDLPTLKRRLSTDIRAGKLTLDNPKLLRVLKDATISQVEIDQPNYSGLKQAKEGRT